jgi:hypothetical protein
VAEGYVWATRGGQRNENDAVQAEGRVVQIHAIAMNTVPLSLGGTGLLTGRPPCTNGRGGRSPSPWVPAAIELLLDGWAAATY